MPAKSTAKTTAHDLSRVSPPLNPAQLDLLRLFERPLTPRQLQDIKQLLSNYLASQVDELGNQLWEEQGLTATDMDKILKSHIRTSYTK